MTRFILPGVLALAMAACTSSDSPTAPAGEPSLARGAGRTYVASDLGALPGATRSSAIAINASGQVVGRSGTAGGEDHAALWERDGSIIDLGTLGGTFSQALGINSRGQVVGVAETAEGVRRAFLWERGTMIDLGTPGGTVSGAVDINARGQVLVGWFGAIGVWERGAITPLPQPEGSVGCTPIAINAAGSVIAQCTVDNTLRSVLIDHAGVTDLGSLGGPLTAALAISPSGTIVGLSARGANLGTAPFIWERGVIQDLTALGAPAGLIPNAINASGQVAGYLGTGAEIRAVLWQAGTTTDLGGAPGEDTYVFDLNAAGVVVGQTVVGNSVHATLWAPS